LSDRPVADSPRPPKLRFFATDSVEKFRRLGPSFLGHAVDAVEHVDLKE
jgi:glutamate racemase